MDTSTQDIGLVRHLVERHFDIWNDADPASRAALLAEVYTPDILVADHAGIAIGHTSVIGLIQRVQGAHAGFSFTPDTPTWNHGLGRITWGYGPRDKPDQIRGEDIFTIRQGLLASLHVFIDSQ